MSGKVFLIILAFLFLFDFTLRAQQLVSQKAIHQTYHRAVRLYNSPESTTSTDSASMFAFKAVMEGLMSLPATRQRDSLLFESASRLGILYEVYNDFSKATATYLVALNYAIHAEEKWRMMIFAGAGYYHLNNFDSASYFLLKAADRSQHHMKAEDRMRLLNTLGVLYNDNGNYLQSKNYFSQALQLADENSIAGRLNSYSLQLNLGTCYMKLGWYDQALILYNRAIHYELVPDPLYMNMGRAYAGLHQYDKALRSFKKVKSAEVPGVWNEMARTAIESNYPDSAARWLQQYRLEKKSIHSNILDDGVNEMYSGELDMIRSKPGMALNHLQKALIIFSGNFTSGNIRQNPGLFTGSFAYYRLFEVLEKKATAWEMIYRNSRNSADLRSAFDTYRATIKLLSYIERSYEMDDAKLLLKQKSGEIFSRAMDVCLQLNRVYPGEQYLEQAFLISEENKASVMSSQIRERNLIRETGTDADLAGEERNIKFQIARLTAQDDKKDNAQALLEISARKAGYETELVNLRRKMEGNKKFYQLKYSDDFPTINELRKSIQPGEALISFFNTAEKIQLFVLDKSSLKMEELDSGISIRRDIQRWIETLQNAENGKHGDVKWLKKRLYEQLSKPLLKLAGSKEQWTVIPDGIFFQLPLESLPGDAQGKLILEDHVISYQFSSRFIIENQHLPNLVDENPALSLAPFVQKGVDLRQSGIGWLQKLPFSGEEVKTLKGNCYLNTEATKSVFLQRLNSFPVVHLATHAVTNMQNPSASFIAFASPDKFKVGDFLYLEEIYSLKMDSCQMLVISACETGRGELVKNEGVMSFTRAFLYAGCPSTINTLWKADDRSTAAILKLFYKNLEAGDTKSRALQKAKIEFIKNNPLSRNPAYWSHIVVTGNPAALYPTHSIWIWVILVVTIGGFLYYFIKQRAR